MPTTHSHSTLYHQCASSKCSSGLPRKPKVDSNRILKEVSDITTFFKKEVKRSCLMLVRELTKLRIAKKKAEKALYRAQAMQEDVKATVQQLMMLLQGAMFARVVPTDSSSCYGCLRDSIYTSLREQIDTDSTIIPEHLRRPAITVETLMELYDGRYLNVVLYDCPVCREPMRMKPTEVNKFSDFFAVVSDILRQPKNCIVNDPHLSDLVIWEDLFHDEIQYV
ncbi:hypothetical protein EDC04DRAFT_2610997 [Pisolithus marmoratus]|nr:hypothetical protein EDC04DRAFT_2610997 [Pisolithus marmoratus]